nr:MAG TPA: hypothetical protein [Ackermannviridae sp.]
MRISSAPCPSSATRFYCQSSPCCAKPALFRTSLFCSNSFLVSAFPSLY